MTLLCTGNVLDRNREYSDCRTVGVIACKFFKINLRNSVDQDRKSERVSVQAK